jgi:uncharacterized protein
LSVSEDRTVQPSAATAPASPIADPGPLGLAAFAATTFLLSAANAGWMTKATGLAFLGYAFAYGGLAQLLAGMWEFRNRNVFGATAFGTYGSFWLGLGLWVQLVVVPTLNSAKTPAALAAASLSITHDKGWILLTFAIFNTYMLIWSLQINWALFGVFLTLELTEIILFIGNFANSSGTIKFGGYVGVLTALVAWYASAAGVANGMGTRLKLPIGTPIL